jgi:hypothetical protein
VTKVQLYLAIGIPMLFNTTLIGVLIALFNAKTDAQNNSMNARFDAVNTRLDAIEKRFDDMRDLWRAELRRVEEVLDARLKHLEQHC